MVKKCIEAAVRVGALMHLRSSHHHVTAGMQKPLIQQKPGRYAGSQVLSDHVGQPVAVYSNVTARQLLVQGSAAL